MTNERETRGVTERFTGRAAVYEQFRERYDADLVLGPLRTWCGLDASWTIADVGAGTGMLSEVFLGNGNRVIAVEPNAEMREACARIHAGEARLTVVDGTAEATGLADESVEMVAVGRAMHWFDQERAAQEFRRVLKPGGWVAVIGFGRGDGGRAENVALEALLQAYTPGGGDTHASYAVYGRLKDWFAHATFHHAEERGETRLGWEAMRGMAMSLSHSPRADEPSFPAFERELAAMFARYAVGGVLTMETRYSINVGQFAP